MGFPGGLDGKESTCNAGDLGLILGWEYHLEEGMATLSSIVAWRIPWTEETGGLQSMGSQRVRHDWATKHSILSDKWQNQNVDRGQSDCWEYLFPCYPGTFFNIITTWNIIFMFVKFCFLILPLETFFINLLN